MVNFSDYLRRQTYKRKGLDKVIKRATLYRRINNPDTLTIYELRFLIKAAELDTEKVMDFITEGKK